MMLKNQAQRTVLAILSYLINLLSITGDTYHEIFRLRVNSDILKKKLSYILDYIIVEFFHSPVL